MTDAFWERFLEFRERSSRRRRNHEAPVLSGTLTFGDDRDESDRLLHDIIDGRVTASICSIDTWNDSGRTIPQTGSLFMGLDGSGLPRCILQTVRVHLVPYRKMTEELALLEGRDRDLTAWQNRWRPVLFEECRQRGKIFNLDTLMVVHVFSVAYYEKDEEFISQF